MVAARLGRYVNQETSVEAPVEVLDSSWRLRAGITAGLEVGLEVANREPPRPAAPMWERWDGAVLQGLCGSLAQLVEDVRNSLIREVDFHDNEFLAAAVADIIGWD
jgi:hypothetical protein